MISNVNYKRVTFSIPKRVYLKLQRNVPKNKRSKFVADLIEKDIEDTDEVTYESVSAFWDNLAKECKRKTNKTAVEMQREDRLSH